MLRRCLSVLGAAALLVVLLPAVAQAAPDPTRTCRSVLSSAHDGSVWRVAPHVMAQQEGTFFGLYADGADAGSSVTYTVCAFHDADEDGVFDARTEALFGASMILETTHYYGSVRARVDFQGVAAGDHVCSRATKVVQPVDGGRKVKTETVTSCYEVGYYMNGRYLSF